MHKVLSKNSARAQKQKEQKQKRDEKLTAKFLPAVQVMLGCLLIMLIISSPNKSREAAKCIKKNIATNFNIFVALLTVLGKNKQICSMTVFYMFMVTYKKQTCVLPRDFITFITFITADKSFRVERDRERVRERERERENARL